jgi:hypothetical protein
MATKKYKAHGGGKTAFSHKAMTPSTASKGKTKGAGKNPLPSQKAKGTGMSGRGTR